MPITVGRPLPVLGSWMAHCARTADGMTAQISDRAARPDGDAGLARRVALLEAVADALGTDLDLAGLLDRILVSVLEVTGVSAGGVFLFDDRRGRLALAAQR